MRIQLFTPKPINTPQKPKNSQNISFKAAMPSFEYLYQKSILYHKSNIFRTNPLNVEKYFEQMGIDARFREGSDYAKKFVSYCCFHTAEIFKQLNHSLPPKIELTSFKNISNDAIGLCLPTSKTEPKPFPLRTVLFNSFEDSNQTIIENKVITLNWENMIPIRENDYKVNFSSVGHFLGSFVHEFAHSFHLHKIYSKFGCPEPHQSYQFNPKAYIILNKLGIRRNTYTPNALGFINPIVHTAINKEVSEYGSKTFAETFAEAYTKDVLGCVDLFNLRLTRNPFPANNKSPIVNQVLNEIWEGNLDDGIGLV